jgi:hypothetical protein
MKNILNKIKLLSITLSFFTLISCGNESLLFENFTKLIETKTPLKPVKSFVANNDTPEDIMIVNKDSKGNLESISVCGTNWSGNLSGPTSMTLSFDKEKKLIVVKTKNTTGSPYTGYDIWEDTFYLSFKEVWSYEENGEKVGIGFKENPNSVRKTSGYGGNIVSYKNKPNVLKILVFGAGTSDWQIEGVFHFQEETLIEDFNKIRTLISK